MSLSEEGWGRGFGDRDDVGKASFDFFGSLTLNMIIEKNYYQSMDNIF